MKDKHLESKTHPDKKLTGGTNTDSPSENTTAPIKNRLTDPTGRRIDYLRISVTDLCNLRCIYCIPDQIIPKLRHDEVLTYEEITRIVTIGAGLGIEKIRITGGEPLVRRNIGQFLKNIGATPGIRDFSITTNGLLLKKNIDILKDAGIRRLNISLDTLRPDTFKKITGVDAFNDAWEGIMATLEAGFSPVKLNAVVFKGINDHEIEDLARLSIDYPLLVRFIEYMPIGMARIGHIGKMYTPEIKERVEAMGNLTPVVRSVNDGPAMRYKLPGAKGEIGFISPISRHFCSECNRLRLTASGKFRPCLLSDREINVKDAIRCGATDADIARLFIDAVIKKPERHTINDKENDCVETQMSAIGG